MISNLLILSPPSNLNSKMRQLKNEKAVADVLDIDFLEIDILNEDLLAVIR
jgi:hypothetical protein